MRNSWSQQLTLTDPQHSKQPSAAGDGSNLGCCVDAAGQIRGQARKQVRGPIDDAWTREEDELVWQCAEMGHGRHETARLLPGSDPLRNELVESLGDPAHLRGIRADASRRR